VKEFFLPSLKKHKLDGGRILDHDPASQLEGFNHQLLVAWGLGKLPPKMTHPYPSGLILRPYFLGGLELWGRGPLDFHAFPSDKNDKNGQERARDARKAQMARTLPFLRAGFRRQRDGWKS